MVRIAVCEDNEIQRDMVSDIVESYMISKGIDRHITLYGDGEDLLPELKAGRFFDIYILDINMPHSNGMDIAASIRYLNDSGAIIFHTTEYDRGGSYDVDAVYYLVKPVSVERFARALDKAMQDVNKRKASVPAYLIRTSDIGDVRISPSLISFIECDNRTPKYHMADGKVYRCHALRGSFSEYVKELLANDYFTFLGPTKLINLNRVASRFSDGIMMNDSGIIYASQQALRDFDMQMNRYTEKRKLRVNE